MSEAWWQVLTLFLVPVGGGIPAGVILADQLQLGWATTAFLYLISDVILALVFEPAMLLFLSLSSRSPRMMAFRTHLARSMAQVTRVPSFHLSPFRLILLTFGTDPMTGRSIAKAAGHGFLSGWLLTIIGDMIFFSVVMISTLYLNSVLGNGVAAAVIVTLLILAMPSLLRKLRGQSVNQNK